MVGTFATIVIVLLHDVSQQLFNNHVDACCVSSTKFSLQQDLIYLFFLGNFSDSYVKS